MADTIQSVLIGGVAGLVSAVLTHFSTRAKLRLDLAAEYDKKLQENRLEAYKELWAMLEPLAKYGRGKVTYNILQKVSDSSRKWYFQTGGIYLTERSRKPYFDWKQAMQNLMDNPQLAGEPELELKGELLAPVIQTGSTLRTALSDDIGTKRLSRI
jgi:hypothetical protein